LEGKIRRAVVGKNTRRTFHLLVGATLTISTSIVGSFLTSSLMTGEQSWGIRLGWFAAGIAVTFFYLRWQLRSQEESSEAIKERISQLASELRKQVQSRSYGARSNLIEAPLRELDLDITPRLGWVRDPRLIEPEPISETVADDFVAAFESSKRRLLIVGEPGSGKTMAAYSLIEYLDERRRQSNTASGQPLGVGSPGDLRSLPR
jgi:Arc/MetJ-type ribon-helix-helix transcriptional regulator